MLKKDGKSSASLPRSSHRAVRSRNNKKDRKLNDKQDDGELLLTKPAPNRLSFGANLENDLMFVANVRGEVEYLFDGLYSAKKLKAKAGNDGRLDQGRAGL